MSCVSDLDVILQGLAHRSTRRRIELSIAFQTKGDGIMEQPGGGFSSFDTDFIFYFPPPKWTHELMFNVIIPIIIIKLPVLLSKVSK